MFESPLYPSNLEMLGSARMTWFVDARRFKGLVGPNQESTTKYTSQDNSPFGSVSLTRSLLQTTWKELAITLRCFP
ncbi:hypothetical protein A8140_21525 [Vibrio campbellii CAIM 519 = NBRC 15631 = ATCC 25920]|nr:hypothetical protein A8140_21525 [Vibrio campbellii CAIM 519 = NBRC 15631 = ATCC 25920]ELU50308.1 hypothetical protein B878_18875 [Vibrio campbellii CAIM 519 = NBRC 15631 = ATCC 25920]